MSHQASTLSQDYSARQPTPALGVDEFAGGALDGELASQCGMKFHYGDPSLSGSLIS